MKHILYSQSISSFLDKAQCLARKIVTQEMGLLWKRSRIHHGNVTYPLHFVVFEHPSTLGYYKESFYEIGINKIFLFHSDRQEFIDLLRHELAHFYCHIKHGPQERPHGPLFHDICRSFGWNFTIAKSEVNLPTQILAKNQTILSKIDKLLALTASANEHEAKSAMQKVDELLATHQLSLPSSIDNDEEMVLFRLFEVKKLSKKLESISTILRLFHVFPIFNRGKNTTYLEIFGKRHLVEVAEHVAYFLEKHLEKLWRQVKKSHKNPLSMKAKHAFFQGVAEGYHHAHKESFHNLSPIYQNALVQIQGELEVASRKYLPHLRSHFSSHVKNQEGLHLGRQKGKELSIPKGIKEKSSSCFHLTMQ